MVPVVLAARLTSPGRTHKDVWIEAGVVLVLATVGGTVAWAVTKWRVVGSELQIDTGLIRRQSVRVPLTRVQSIDVVRPLLARALGVSELRVEVAGHGSGRSRLAYLGEDEALRVRAQLLAVAHGLHEDTPEPPSRPLWQVANGRLLASMALGPLAVALVLLVVLVVGALTAPKDVAASLAGVIVSFVLALGAGIKKRLNNEFAFTVSEGLDGLRLHSGITQTRAETIPYGRVQAVRWVQPVLWRPFGWVRLEIDVARQRQRDREERESNQLIRAIMPVGTPADADLLLSRVFPGRAHRAAADGCTSATAGSLAGPAVVVVAAHLGRRHLPAHPYRPGPPRHRRRPAREGAVTPVRAGAGPAPAPAGDRARRHGRAALARERHLSRRRRGRPVVRAPDRRLARRPQGRPAALAHRAAAAPWVTCGGCCWPRR